MPAIHRCPACAALTMLSSCPACRTATMAYSSAEEQALLSSPHPQQQQQQQQQRGDDGSVESPQSAQRTGKRDRATVPSRLAVDTGASSDKADTEKTREELVAELHLARKQREELVAHLEELARANEELSEQLQKAKEQMMLSAADIRDLHASNTHIHSRAARVAERLLRENTELQRRVRQSDGDGGDEEEDELLQIPERLSTKTGSLPPASESHRPDSEGFPSFKGANDAEGSTEGGSLAPVGEAAHRSVRGRAPKPLSAWRRSDSLVRTPVSIASETPSTYDSPVKAAGGDGEVERLRRMLRRREEQLRRITERARRAETVVQELADGLDGARALTAESDRILSSSPGRFNRDYDAGVAGAPSAAVKDRYEGMLARQGLSPYDRQYVGAAAAAGYNPRPMPSALPDATFAGPDHLLAEPAESLVS